MLRSKFIRELSLRSLVGGMSQPGNPCQEWLKQRSDCCPGFGPGMQLWESHLVSMGFWQLASYREHVTTGTGKDLTAQLDVARAIVRTSVVPIFRN